jgi:hypothetical protein
VMKISPISSRGRLSTAKLNKSLVAGKPGACMVTEVAVDGIDGCPWRGRLITSRTPCQIRDTSGDGLNLPNRALVSCSIGPVFV